MLDEISSFPADEAVYRLANPPKGLRALRQLNLDKESFLEVEAEFRLKKEEDSLEILLNEPFTSKPQLAAIFKNDSRFSDGSWKVGYFSLELETSRKEIEHHSKDRIIENKGYPVFYEYFKCRYQGETKDLRTKSPDWPGLTSNDYHFCQKLGREAVGQDIDGFFSPSARNAGGTSVPVFKRSALSKGPDGKILGKKKLFIDPVSNQVISTDIHLD